MSAAPEPPVRPAEAASLSERQWPWWSQDGRLHPQKAGPGVCASRPDSTVFCPHPRLGRGGPEEEYISLMACFSSSVHGWNPGSRWRGQEGRPHRPLPWNQSTAPSPCAARHLLLSARLGHSSRRLSPLTRVLRGALGRRKSILTGSRLRPGGWARGTEGSQPPPQPLRTPPPGHLAPTPHLRSRPSKWSARCSWEMRKSSKGCW